MTAACLALLGRELRLALRHPSDTLAAVLFFVLVCALFPFGVGPAPETLARLLMLGDSLTAGYGLPQSEALPVRLEAALRARGRRVRVINAGVSGDTTAGGRARLDWALADRPQAAIVALGANDALRGLPAAELTANLAAILDTLAARGIPALLAGMRAPPNFGPDYARELDAALPWLETLCRHRAAHGKAQQEANAAQQDLARLNSRRQAAAAEAPSPAALEEAEQTLRDAETQLAQAAAWRQTAQEVAQRFHQVKDERSCPYCRQNLPHEHVAQEAVRLDQQRRQAEQALHAAEQHAAAVRRAWDDLRRQAQDAKATLDQLDRDLHDRRHALRAAEQRQQDSLQACDEARGRLPAALRQRAEASAAFPACANVQQAREEAESLAAEVTALDRQLARLRDHLKRGRQTLAEQEANRQALDRQAQQQTHDLAECEAEVRHRQEALAAARAALPDDWRPWTSEEAARRLRDLQAEQRRLTESRVVEQSQSLQAAQEQHDDLLKTLEETDRQIADIPAAARRDPAALAAEGRQAQEEEAACRQRHLEANNHLADLRRHCQERETLDVQYRQADRRRHLGRRLADLLGRQGLQRDLVRTAERQIVEYADATLDRLSSGALHLELRTPADDETERALDLAARTDTSPDPIDAPFLSGSQRFRVAVALSLAIGQYASHHRRPVRSVIIDEGFGCLDPDNRQTMIQELHNLRAHLDRIILVTHQDDIAQAFPNGYHCQPQEGMTRLIPFHR